MKKTIRNTVLIVLAMAIVASVSIFGTLAWLSDEDGAVNVMTLGNVYIDQNEYEWDNDELVDFTQGKPLLPYVGQLGWTNTDYMDGAYRSFTMNNVVDKYVTVTNTGSTPAYVRTILALEMGEYDTVDEFYYKVVGVATNAANGAEFKFEGAWNWSDKFVAEIDGNNYLILVATHEDPVMPGEETIPSLLQVYMNKEADNEEVIKVDGNGNGMYDILAFSQAVQSTGFASAEVALTEAFGEISANDLSTLPWDANNIKYPNVVNTAEALINALNNGQDVYLNADIDLANVEWDPIDLYSGTLNGQGYSILNLKGENGLFEALDGATVKNLSIVDADIDATSYYTGIIAGQIKKNASAPQTVIENVTVSGTVVGGNYYTGGIIGADSGYDTVIRNCVNNADISANGQQVGGILGYAKRQTLIDNCLNTGNISGTEFIGGIIGLVALDDEDTSLMVTVQNCTNYGEVGNNGSNTAFKAYFGDIAGAVGREGGKAPLVECTAYLLNNTVVNGQNVYGGKVNVATGHDELINAVVTGNGTVNVVDSTADLQDAIQNGGNTVLVDDVQWNSGINNDATIDLNGNTFEATYSYNLGNNADLTMTNGDYVVNNTYGHIDVRPDSAEGSTLYFENVNFTNNKLNYSYGTSTNRLGSVVEVCPTITDAHATVVFKNCTFNNAQVVIEGLSGKTGTFDVTFENCTFNALTSSAPIYVQNYVKGTLNVIGCTFNLECTSGTASAISISSSSSTSVVLNAENNTINATAAVASGEAGTVEQVKVNGTPANIKFAFIYSNTTANIVGTTATGIAA